jgi:hypothetical protein
MRADDESWNMSLFSTKLCAQAAVLPGRVATCTQSFPMSIETPTSADEV